MSYDQMVDFYWPIALADSQAALAVSEQELVRPVLAESWEISDDGLTYTFELRQGVRSPFGNELTAEDVVWSLRKQFAVGATGVFVLAVIGGLPNADTVVAVGPHTVQITLPAPQPRLLNALGFTATAIIYDSKQVLSNATEDDEWALGWLSENTAGFGPYELVDFGAGGEEITFAARFDYWDTSTPPVGKTVIQRHVPESSSRLQLLLTGESHYAQNLSPRELDEVDAADGLTTTKIENTTVLFAPLTQAEPWNNPTIRQAFAMAVPYQDILDSVLRGRAAPYRSVLLPFVRGYTDEFAYNTDPDAARAMLDGFDLPPLRLSYPEGRPVSEQTSVLVQAALNDVGADVSLEKQPSNVFAQRRIRGENEFFVDDLATPGIAAADYYFNLYGGAAGFFNFFNWVSDDFIALIPTANNSAEDAREAQRIWMMYLPFIPIAWTGEIHAHSDFLRIPFGHVANGTFYTKDFRPA
ncbi:MAG: ABC transporter substrate-binding protein [Actinomycetia bacterium]|nr:ABC transporter substrate-binding protein [Actinomycetes bacterium]